jgi:hypothetical protein
MNRGGKFILIGFLLVCVVVLGVYLFNKHPSISTPQSSPTSRATEILKPQPSPTLQVTSYPTPKPYPTPQVLENGWHKYTYIEAGYSVEFPPDANLEVSADAILDYSQTIIRFPSSIDKDGAVLKIFTDLNKDKKSLDQYADEELNRIFNGNPPKVEGKIQKYSTIISGHSALYFTSSPNRPIVFIESGDRFYRLMLVPNMTKGNIPKNESVDLFWKIINTFMIY